MLILEVEGRLYLHHSSFHSPDLSSIENYMPIINLPLMEPIDYESEYEEIIKVLQEHGGN